MTTKLCTVFAAFTIVFFSFCTPALQVHTDYDKSANFSVYKTFAMYQLDEKSKTVSELNANRIISAIKAEMVKRGYKEETSNPDLMVNAVIVLKDMKYVTANTQYYNQYYGYGGIYRPYGWGGTMGSGYTTYDVQNYTDGSLIIDVVDSKTQKLIWESTGNRDIDGPLENPDTQIPAAVSKIMAPLPSLKIQAAAK